MIGPSSQGLVIFLQAARIARPPLAVSDNALILGLTRAPPIPIMKLPRKEGGRDHHQLYCGKPSLGKEAGSYAGPCLSAGSGSRTLTKL
jgi:hypothetical protein